MIQRTGHPREGIRGNRSDLQKLAQVRVRDAGLLLKAKRWPAAYYLAGYAVECGLKACIVGRLEREPDLIFVERRFSERCWTHNLESLLALAGLAATLATEAASHPELAVSGDIAKQWDEESRYRLATKGQADDLYEAVADTKHGVLKWIRARW